MAMGLAEPLNFSDKARLDNQALVRHLLDRFHRVHRSDLAALIAMARRVEKTHADHPDCPLGLSRFLESMEESLDEHMRTEEEILFPVILSHPTHPMIDMSIGLLRDEHDDQIKMIKDLYRLTGALHLPADACGVWQQLYRGLNKFAEDLVAHIEIENNMLFARLDARKQSVPK
jgi:regulator of cell morphogenesis and NO signaling